MIAITPLNSEVITAVLDYFSKTAGIMNLLVASVVGIKVVLLFLKLSGTHEYLEVLEATILYFLVIYLFPQFFGFVNEIIGEIAKQLIWTKEVVPPTSFFEELSGIIKDHIWSYQLITDLVPFLVSHTVQAISTLLLSVLIAIGPIFIFMSTILGMNGGVSRYLTIVLSTMMWPVVWNLIGGLADHLYPSFSETSLMKFTFYWVLMVFQLLSPLFSFLLITNLSPSAAIQKATGAVRGLTKLIG